MRYRAVRAFVAQEPVVRVRRVAETRSALYGLSAWGLDRVLRRNPVCAPLLHLLLVQARQRYQVWYMALRPRRDRHLHLPRQHLSAQLRHRSGHPRAHITRIRNRTTHRRPRPRPERARATQHPRTLRLCSASRHRLASSEEANV